MAVRQGSCSSSCTYIHVCTSTNSHVQCIPVSPCRSGSPPDCMCEHSYRVVEHLPACLPHSGTCLSEYVPTMSQHRHTINTHNVHVHVCTNINAVHAMSSVHVCPQLMITGFHMSFINHLCHVCSCSTPATTHSTLFMYTYTCSRDSDM